jgi:hypothetical protein
MLSTIKIERTIVVLEIPWTLVPGQLSEDFPGKIQEQTVGKIDQAGQGA